MAAAADWEAKPVLDTEATIDRRGPAAYEAWLRYRAIEEDLAGLAEPEAFGVRRKTVCSVGRLGPNSIRFCCLKACVDTALRKAFGFVRFCSGVFGLVRDAVFGFRDSYQREPPASAGGYYLI